MSSNFNDKQLDILKKLSKELGNKDFKDSFNTREYGNTSYEFRAPNFFYSLASLGRITPDERKERFREIIKNNLEDMYLVSIGNRILENRAKRSNQQFSIDAVYNPFEDLVDLKAVKTGATIFALISLLTTNLCLLSAKISDISIINASILSVAAGAGIGAVGTLTLAGVGALGAKLVHLLKESSYKIGNYFTHFEDQCIALEKSSQLFKESFDSNKDSEKVIVGLEDCFQKGIEKQGKRNNVCSCGSGLKYKNCCGLLPKNIVTEEKIVEDLNKIIKNYREQYLNVFIAHINELIDKNRLEGGKTK